VSCTARIAEAVPGARLAVLKECGHFAYIEAPEVVRRAMDDFFGEG
jgi:pimeloyl-ACP methyl ester carboxylesterase